MDDSYYRGFTENYHERIKQHNSGWSKYTSGKMPWKLVYVENFETKKEALSREKSLKKYSRSQIKEVINSSRNLLRK